MNIEINDIPCGINCSAACEDSAECLKEIKDKKQAEKNYIASLEDVLDN